MKTTVKQSPALARTGALTLAILLGFSAAALPAQAQTAGKSKTAATKKAPQASSRSGDYIVAIVNSEPVTNHEVNRRASMLAQQLAANKVAVPDRATLLRRALNDEILQKAATFSARNSGMTVGDEELRQIEANLARDRKVSVEEFRKRIIAERGITASQYRQSLLDQILLERVRDARINAEVARISDIEALDLLREEFGRWLPLSLMSQYKPTPAAHSRPPFDRHLEPEEYQTVVAHAQELGFENLLVQPLTATDDFFPDFEKDRPFKGNPPPPA